jgi:RNA 2',3'-cyclic 3'-phosphodiesterase
VKSGMTAIRAFIAIDLPPPLREKLDAVIGELQTVSSGAVRWVPAKNIHLTLKFLGDISPANLQVLSKILAVEAQNCPPFEMGVGGVGAFPNDRRPRVVWVGVKAPPVLENLQRNIESETRRLGYTPEERPFSPHLTIGRVTHNAKPQDIRQLSETLVNLDTGNLGHINVDKIFLYRSDLYPSGAVYRPLFSCTLTGT